MLVRGIDERPAVGAFAERQPTAEELMSLPLKARADAIWDSGVHPTTPAMVEAFQSCASIPGIGTFLVMAVQTGLTPNGKLYRGEHRNDALVWPNGCPDPLPKRVPPRKPSKRAEREAWRWHWREHGLFTRLSCGCLEECPGLEWHAETEAAEEARERALREEHARWDTAREQARRELEDELARVTLSEPVNVDPEAVGDFALILARDDEP